MKHVLVPSHRILSEKEKEELLKGKNIKLHQLPKILINDPAIKELKPKVGDVVEIIRKSPTSGETKYYRVVVIE
ncbi:DNA-directed RNA polymerase subunit H [Nanoarchaeota archaeon]|mgnify:FL=1|nr:MAG: DNA-directed RNA polymerase subunit H [Nanoarchaeota archaeon]